MFVEKAHGWKTTNRDGYLLLQDIARDRKAHGTQSVTKRGVATRFPVGPVVAKPMRHHIPLELFYRRVRDVTRRVYSKLQAKMEEVTV